MLRVSQPPAEGFSGEMDGSFLPSCPLLCTSKYPDYV
jgi:hypothetical protein